MSDQIGIMKYTFRPDGDANKYIVLKRGPTGSNDWFMTVHINGELHTVTQTAIMRATVRNLNEGNENGTN